MCIRDSQKTILNNRIFSIYTGITGVCCAVAPLVALLAVLGTGVVLWIWTKSRKASSKVPRADGPVGADASADPATVRGSSRAATGVSHRR